MLQEQEFYRVGGTEEDRDRCAGHLRHQPRPAAGWSRSGAFRRDLFFRLNIGRIVIPPLRERPEEIRPLARLFLQRLGEQKKTTFRRIDPAAERLLAEHHWPGNVRELQSAMERVSLLWDEEELTARHLEFLAGGLLPAGPAAAAAPRTGAPADPPADPPLPEDRFDLEQATLDLVRRALEKHRWNKTETARYLGITRGVLYTYLKRLEPR